MDDNEVARTLGRMEGKLDMLITRFDKVENRTGVLEKKQWYHSGALGLAVVFIAPKLRAMMGI